MLGPPGLRRPLRLQPLPFERWLMRRSAAAEALALPDPPRGGDVLDGMHLPGRRSLSIEAPSTLRHPWGVLGLGERILDVPEFEMALRQLRIAQHVVAPGGVYDCEEVAPPRSDGFDEGRGLRVPNLDAPLADALRREALDHLQDFIPGVVKQCRPVLLVRLELHIAEASVAQLCNYSRFITPRGSWWYDRVGHRGEDPVGCRRPAVCARRLLPTMAPRRAAV
mmetsp:Transcript_79234/g.229145  ORF Transcript_79234/g.229145 Transcript_79234/m.229145 type:complete len:223 (-) Transcript_79234:33-701(-)